LTGDESLGLRIAMAIDPRLNMSWPPPFSMHEHIGASCSTLRESVLHQIGMVRLLRDAHTIVMDGPPQRPTVRFEFSLADEPRSLKQFHMAAGVLLSRRILNDPESTVLEARFAHAEPSDLSAFNTFFHAPLRFGAESYALVVDGAVMDRLLPNANPLMLVAFERRVQRALEALPAIDDFVEMVRERIEAELPDGNTNAASVAEKMGVSQRTLHRRLQAEGATYQDLLDKVRCRLSQRHLASRKHTINEVAQLVGFAQPSAFHRAFKAWTGETPSEYQERLASPQSSPSASPSRR
jgi:AraC-like DNA-binding protein